MKESLALRVLIASFIFLGLPLLLSSFLLFRSTYRGDLANTEINLRESASFRAETFIQLKALSPVLAEEIDFFVDFENLFKEKQFDLFSQKLREIALFRPGLDFYVLGTEEKGKYRILAGSDESNVARGFVSYHNFRDMDTGKSELITYWPIEGGRQVPSNPPYLFFVYPILSEENQETLGYLLLVSHIADKLPSLLIKSEEHDQEISFALLQEDSIVIAASDSDLEGKYFFPLSLERRAEINEEMEQMHGIKIADHPLTIIPQENSNILQFAFGKEIELGYLHAITQTNTYLLAYSPKDAIFAAAIRHFFLFYTLFGFIIVAGSVFTYKLTNLMSRPLRSLSMLMEKVKEGDFRDRFKPEPLGFEINFLGLIFNHMIDSLLENIKKVEDNRVMKETYEKELEIGEKVQRQLLPQVMPNIEGVEIHAKYLRSTEVGGDFYDVSLSRGKLRVLAADAAGRGISSCLYSLGLRSELRAYSLLEDDLGVLLSKANNLFCHDTAESGMFITVIMGSFDLQTRILSYYSCGHVPGYVRKKDGTLIELEHHGMAMGLAKSEPFEVNQIKLDEGDLLFFYTDGLIEVRDENGHHFGEARLKNSLLQKNWVSAYEVVEGLAKEIIRFRGKTSPEDEVTLLAVKIKSA